MYNEGQTYHLKAAFHEKFFNPFFSSTGPFMGENAEKNPDLFYLA